MKFKLVIKLVDCVPSTVKMSLIRDDAAEAIEHAESLLEANCMISSVTVCNAEGEALKVVDYEATVREMNEHNHGYIESEGEIV